MNETSEIKNKTITSFVTQSVEEAFKTGARFVGLTYTNEAGETSKQNILLGVKLETLYKKDLTYLTNLIGSLEGIKKVACQELIDSISNSLSKGIGQNDGYTKKDYYTPVTPGGEVKKHVGEDGLTTVYLRGFVVKKSVITKGIYKVVKSSEKTLAKNEIRRNLKSGKIREFKLNQSVVSGYRTNGMSVEVL